MSKKDYTKFSKIDERKIKEAVAEFEDAVSPESKEGIVVDCLRLNVRVAPYSDADILTVVDASTHVMIDESESVEDFYKVCTETGAEGYCMKSYIKILE